MGGRGSPARGAAPLPAAAGLRRKGAGIVKAAAGVGTCRAAGARMPAFRDKAGQPAACWLG